MVYVTSRIGVWDVGANASHTPDLELPTLQPDRVLKITCQFFARTFSDDLGDGFDYAITSSAAPHLVPLTPARGLVQGSDSWQQFSHVLLFEVLSPQSDETITFNIEVSRGDMNGRGFMMNYVMMAEWVEQDSSA